MPRKRSGRPRGRPRKANAKRRFTSRIGRKFGVDGTDRGTAQLRRKKRIVAGGAREDLELSPASVLFAREHIDRRQFDTLASITEWLRLSHAAIPGINVAGLWKAIAAMASRTLSSGASNAALGLAVANARRMAWVLRRLDGSRALIVELAEGRCPPIVIRAHERSLTTDDRVELETLRRGLDAVPEGSV